MTNEKIESAKINQAQNKEIVEKSSTELVAKMLSKNDAIRVAIELIGIGLILLAILILSNIAMVSPISNCFPLISIG